MGSFPLSKKKKFVISGTMDLYIRNSENWLVYFLGRFQNYILEIIFDNWYIFEPLKSKLLIEN